MVLGHPVRRFDRLDSTNREAERWALAGAPDGALVVAQHQLAGRGRLGRSWFDLPGKSLLFSLVLRPSIPASGAPAITFVAAVALADALARWVPRGSIEIKWPNDVLVGSRKGAGILLEMRCEAQRVEHIILGVGVNVGGDPEEFPDEIRDSSTAVAAWSSAAPNPSDVLGAFLQEFELRYQAFLDAGLSTIVPRWNRWFRGIGQRLRVRTPSAVLEGTARGLGPGGALVLDLGGQRTVEVLAGDVELSTTRGP
jgi:BirA family biotin operon repressor/biotin-[acetyl-CoA-carboxylase] ligase